MARSLPKKARIPGVEDVVVVASGKGGVGKSTTAVNLAVTLAQKGKRVGLLDGDVFGPSIPLMLNIKEEPLVNDQNLMIPPVNFNVKCLSMGLITDANQAIVWRGPLVMSALQRLLKGAVWGPLDILIVDTPPGTGDVHLSLAQNTEISGVVLVSTPQTAALEITARGADMYRKFGVPIVGITENMKDAVCSNCNTKFQLFDSKTEEFAKKMGTTVLTSVPVDPKIAESCDKGQPMVAVSPDSDYSKSFNQLGDLLIEFLLKRKTENKQ